MIDNAATLEQTEFLHSSNNKREGGWRVVNFLENDVVTDSESIRREVAVRGKMNGYNEEFLCGFRDVGDWFRWCAR